METDEATETPYQSSHLLVLASYTVLVAGLVAETLLMGWELWALPLILASVALCWLVHIRRRIPTRQRLWIYTTLMMGTFFFYGTHVTSTFDLAPLMMIEIIIFTTTGERALVTFCQATYYLTLAYDLAAMVRAHTQWDSLLVSRVMLHVVLMLLAGWLARIIIAQWATLFRASDERIVRLADSSRRMSAFLANLSHELRTPVNAIMGTTSTMLEQDARASERQDLGTIREAGRRLSEQIGEILDFSEIESAHLTLNLEPYTVSSLLNDLAAEMRPKLANGIELVFDVETDVPAGLVSDVGKLRTILFHLITNSLWYTRAGGVYVHVSALRKPYGVNLCVEVTDTGAGIAANELAHVYERFYQAASGRALRTGGLGLGLCVVAGFVDALGGFVTMQSEEGVGTTVRVSIPQEVADERPCMSVVHPERLCLGGFLDMAKYESPQVREFYNHMVFNLVNGLGTPMHRVDNAADLRQLVDKVELTHLFVGQEEYLGARDLVEELARRMLVVVVTSEGFAAPAASRVTLMPKPFYCFPVASILNAPVGVSYEERGQMRCEGVRALVVDDEPMNLNVARAILARYGMRVLTCASGEEAIGLCESRPFDIVFMDHMMPQMDGIEAMRRIRHVLAAEHRDVPIVALTANALSTARERFVAEGFDGFVAKPIERPELERVLRRVLPPATISYEARAAVEKETRGDPDRGSQDRDELPQARISYEAQVTEERKTQVTEEKGTRGTQSQGVLDVACGLAHCMGDEELYDELVVQFASDAPTRAARLSDALATGEMADYAIVVHALKSAALTIGASELGETARQLEAAAKEGKADLVRERHEQLLELLEQVRSACEQRVPQAPGDATPPEVFEFSPDD